jgi:hypothetical protein
MDWTAALVRIATATTPIKDALHSGAVQTAVAAFHHPLLLSARQAVLSELHRQNTVTALHEASRELRRQHAELLAQSELTPPELERMGVLSGLALVLSAQALAQTLSDEERFVHAVDQIGPWLDRAAACGVIPGSRPLPATDPETQRTIATARELLKP